MAFSGQYAAAQLAKLDHSPLFPGCTVPLAQELSDYLGYAPDFAPPSYVAWARSRGYLPRISDNWHFANFVVPVLESEHDFTGYESRVIATSNAMIGDGMMDTSEFNGPLEEVRRRAAGFPLYWLGVLFNVDDEDQEFCSRWYIAHMPLSWPNTLSGVHPAIAGAVRIYGAHWRRWQNHALDQAMIRYEHNRRLEV